MSSSFGTIFRLTTWGESHGPALGVVIEGCPAGIPIAVEDIQLQLDRRRVGQSKVTTPRNEKDRAEILSGVFEGVTTGAPISLITYNGDVDSSKYENLRDVFRPGHADYTYWAKYGHRDHRGGGRSSARETWGRVAAGAIARKILATAGVDIYGFAREIGGIRAETFDRDEIERNIVRSPDPVAAEKMIDAIMAVKAENDSLGGIVEVHALNVPVGLGEPTFDKLDGLIGHAMHSIPAVKGVEIGEGFDVTQMRGSQANDSFTVENGRVHTRSNNSGASSVVWQPASRSLYGLRSSRHRPSRALSKPWTRTCSRGRSWSKGGTTLLLYPARCPLPRPCWQMCWPISICVIAPPASAGRQIDCGSVCFRFFGRDDDAFRMRVELVELVASVDSPILKSGQLQHQHQLAGANPPLGECGSSPRHSAL